jgi:hypothetical protein
MLPPNAQPEHQQIEIQNLALINHRYFWSSNKLLATIFVGLAVVLVTAMTACGSGSSDDTVASEGAVLDEEGLRLTTKVDSFYTIEDLEAVGFKKIGSSVSKLCRALPTFGTASFSSAISKYVSTNRISQPSSWA